MTPLHEVIINKNTKIKPIWIMRQAGRYLPEFREIRKQNPNFINLCLNENLSSEITLQPLKRFNLDAAIIFSDILMLPYGLNQKVEFEKGFGPKLGEINLEKMSKLDEVDFVQKVYPVYKAIKKVSTNSIVKNKNTIGFVGAPWTLLVYIINQQSPKKNLKKDFFKDEFLINRILLILEKFLKIHIKNQIENGANVIQIFDSWAGLLDERDLPNYVYSPTLNLVNYVKSLNTPVICFPREIKNYKEFCDIVKPDAVGIDYNVDPKEILNNIKIPIQGGLDPKILLTDKEKIKKETIKYLEIFKNHPYIFNLGHGVLPETDPSMFEYMVNTVKKFLMKKAIVLFNLGGPDKLENVEPFLFNLFNDPAILNLPSFFRYPLAKLISNRRAPTAKKIYQELGGSSPILKLTKEQSNALELKLNNDDQNSEYKCFIVMRCWHPRAEEVINHVRDFNPDEIILMPLYPQYSAATSGSSIKEWKNICKKNNLKIKTSTICCYPTDDNFIFAHKEEILKKINNLENFKLIFSAHGLPEKNIKKGDPYQWQVEQSVKKIVKSLNIENLDWILSYQSRVGPLKWIGPSTEDIIVENSKIGKHIVLVPIAFVSEHSETLVELDIEYKELADKNGCKNYTRVPALGTNENYIKAMSNLIIKKQDYNFNGELFPPKAQCPNQFIKCPCLNYE